YVVRPPSEAEQAVARAAHLAEWEALYEATFTGAAAAPGDFNLTGWQSSYTGASLPAEEMRAWVETTVAQLQRLQPQDVLEIGCGTGLLLTRLAPACRSYVGL